MIKFKQWGRQLIVTAWPCYLAIGMDPERLTQFNMNLLVLVEGVKKVLELGPVNFLANRRIKANPGTDGQVSFGSGVIIS